MNIQPHSKTIRKYIPPEVFFHLVSQQKRRSYIGLPLKSWSMEQIKKRITELEALEANGFVYLGEKNWLETFVSTETPIAKGGYDAWVKDNFEKYLKTSFHICQDDRMKDEEMKIWMADINVSDRQLAFEELKTPLFRELDDLEVFVLGDELSPSSTHLVQAFEFLHHLEYSLTTFSAKKSWPHPLTITGIDLTNTIDPARWELNVISDYGSEWDETIVSGIAWRQA